MKRVLTVILAVLLVAALAVPALGEAWIMYTTKSVKVYDSPSSHADVIKKIGSGKKLLIETTEGSWYAILVEDPEGGQMLGWIKGKYLSESSKSSGTTRKKKEKTTKKPAAQATPKPEDARQKINSVLSTMKSVEQYTVEIHTQTADGAVALREEPTVNGKLIYHLENGHQLTVLAEGEGWYQVRDDEGGNVGYMASKYLSALEAADVSEVPTLDEDAAPEEAAPVAVKTVRPMPVDIDLSALEDGEYTVSFDRADLVQSDEDGLVLNNVHIYTRDYYDFQEIDDLAVGDTLVMEGRELPVHDIVRNHIGVIVNGGLDAEDGCELVVRSGAEGYTVQLWDDYATYTDQGATSLPFAEGATFTDGWNIEVEPVTVDYAEIAAAVAESENDTFYQNNTTIQIEGGRIVKLERIYNP